MYDFHIHSIVSFDGHDTGLHLAQAAAAAGMKEICFTDHMDYDPRSEEQTMLLDPEKYSAEYDELTFPNIAIRRGVEFGMLIDNRAEFRNFLQQRDYDFVLGSVHFAEGLDVYFKEYWEDKTPWQAQHRFLEETLQCVQLHEDFDVLAHLTFLNKSPHNPAKIPMPYDNHREILDEILRTLAQKGKGLEMNTSGVDRNVGFLPTEEYFRRFKELGGEIVTVGSDAHRTNRVGQYCSQACEILGEIFGYVCTFENRRPVFHKL